MAPSDARAQCIVQNRFEALGLFTQFLRLILIEMMSEMTLGRVNSP